MTASLPPLANVVAFHSVDPGRVARVRAELERTWPDVQAVGPWLVATRALPRSRPLPAGCQMLRLAFTEGAEQVAAAPGGVEHMATVMRGRSFERLSQIPGDFGVLSFGDHEVTAVRSASGRVPLYWWTEGDDVAIGTLLTDVVRLRSAALRPDPLLAALWASGQAMFVNRRTPVAGVWTANPGEVVRVGIAGTSIVQPWYDPWPEDLPAAPRGGFAAKADRFGHAIRSTLERELASDGGNLLSLSGGVDSSTLAFLARQASRPLSALSFVPADGTPARSHERSYIDPLVAELAISPHWVHELTARNRVDWLGRLPEVAMPVLHPVLCALGPIVEQADISVLVGGEFCDELCGGDFALRDWIRTAAPSEVARRALGGQRQGLRSWARHRTRRGAALGSPHRPLPAVVADDLRLTFEAWRADRAAHLAASPKVHAHTIELLAANDGAVAQNWEVCSSLGVRRTFPFLTREVIEAVAACRPAELITPVAKRLSRTAFREEVPERWLQRADAGDFGPDPDPSVPAPVSLPVALEQVLRPEVMAGAEHQFTILPGLALQELVQFATNLHKVGVWGAAGGPR